MKWHTVIEYVLAPAVVTLASVGIAVRARDVALPAAVIAAIGASKALKKLVDEPRPACSDEHDQESFPSGHATAISAFGASLLLLTRRADVAAASAATIAVVNASRIASCDHRLRDVLAGDAIGIAFAAVTHRLLRR